MPSSARAANGPARVTAMLRARSSLRWDKVSPPKPCSTMAEGCPNALRATAWPSSWTSTDTSTTATHMMMRRASPRLYASSTEAIQKNGSIRTGMPSTWKCALAFTTRWYAGPARRPVPSGCMPGYVHPYRCGVTPDAVGTTPLPDADHLPEGGEKARAVRAMFDTIAPRYDLVNRIMTFRMDVGWRRRAIKALDLGTRSVVLDLACGTGDMFVDHENGRTPVRDKVCQYV